MLTRNQRQARILRHLHDRARLSAGDAVWPTARVLPLATWLEAWWREAVAERPELPELLPPAAIAWLWREEVAVDAGGLLDPAARDAALHALMLPEELHARSAPALQRHIA